MNNTLKALRETLLPDLDPNLRSRDSSVLFSLVGFLLLYWILFFIVYTYESWSYVLILPLGILLQVIANINHEILHGNVVRSKTVMHFITLPGMFLNLTSPHYWNHTHLFHHKLMDTTAVDKIEESKNESKPQVTNSKLLFLVNYFFLNSLMYRINQITFLKNLGLKRIFQRRKFTFIFFEVLAICLFHFLLFAALPLGKWILIDLVPTLIYCFISSCFFITSHSNALNKEAKAIRIFSVRANQFIDGFFFHLGYHVEHHLFPDVPQKNLPLISNFLDQKKLFLSHRYQQVPAIKMTFWSNFNQQFNNQKVSK